MEKKPFPPFQNPRDLTEEQQMGEEKTAALAGVRKPSAGLSSAAPSTRRSTDMQARVSELRQGRTLSSMSNLSVSSTGYKLDNRPAIVLEIGSRITRFV
jgi:hypothetical protein